MAEMKLIRRVHVLITKSFQIRRAKREERECVSRTALYGAIRLRLTTGTISVDLGPPDS